MKLPTRPARLIPIMAPGGPANAKPARAPIAVPTAFPIPAGEPSVSPVATLVTPPTAPPASPEAKDTAKPANEPTMEIVPAVIPLELSAFGDPGAPEALFVTELEKDAAASASSENAATDGRSPLKESCPR